MIQAKLILFYFNYIFFQCLNELTKLVKITALWKGKHFVTSSQAICFLPLVEPALIRVHTCIQANLPHMASYTICNDI